MRILVIKLGALGDLVLAFQAFADIRAHHPGAEITLLTTFALRRADGGGAVVRPCGGGPAAGLVGPGRA